MLLKGNPSQGRGTLMGQITRSNYTYWKECMKIFIQFVDYKLWLVIKNIPSIPKKKVDDKEDKTEKEFNDEDMKKIEQNAKAKSIFYSAVNPYDFRKITRYKTAKQMWDKLEVTHEGTSQVKEAKIDMLVHEYELFNMEEEEKIDEMFEKFSNIVTILDALGKVYTDRELVRKILRSLTKEWQSKVAAIQEGRDLNTITYDELRALAIFTRAALLDGLSPTVFVVYRQGIATLALAPMAFSPKRRQSLKISLGLRSILLMFATSLIGVTANQNAYFKGLYYASSTAATAMSNLIPALTFVIATIVGFEKIDLRSLRSIAKILGTVCCVSGALTMALLKGQKLLHMEFLPSTHLTASGSENWVLGCLLLLASSVFWSCWMIMQVPISSSCPDHLLSTFWMCLFATIQSAIFALLFEQDLQPWILHSSLEFSCCLYAGIGSAVSFFIQTWCISERGPLYCAMFNPLAAVITALITVTFLQEELYIGSLIGAIGVIAGLYIVLWGKAKEFEGIKQEAQSNLKDDEIISAVDLEEPLLSEKSEHVAESKMEP